MAFSNQQSYIAAISARFVQLQHGDIDKRVSHCHVIYQRFTDHNLITVSFRENVNLSALNVSKLTVKSDFFLDHIEQCPEIYLNLLIYISTTYSHLCLFTTKFSAAFQVEVKPYVLDDQLCDECHGARCAGKFAPFFCANVTCLQYYCEQCWAIIHSRQGREFHKPLVKEGADRPRTVPFRW